MQMQYEKNYAFIEELGTCAQSMLQNVEILCGKYLRNMKRMPREVRIEKLDDIYTLFSQIKRTGKDKSNLSIKTQEIVDEYVMYLCAYRAKYIDMPKKALSSSKQDEVKLKADLKEIQKKQEEREQSTNSLVRSCSEKKKKKRSRNYSGGRRYKDKHIKKSKYSAKSTGSSRIKRHKPVVANELRYCLCQQVTYGKMIGCDNLACPIEWFHYGCVGLKHKPNGKWFCRQCKKDMKRN